MYYFVFFILLLYFLPLYSLHLIIVTQYTAQIVDMFIKLNTLKHNINNNKTFHYKFQETNIKLKSYN